MAKRKRGSETRSRQASTSLEPIDSNATILPARSTKRKQHPNQEAERAETKRISKMQERKLKKLEEEKERALMALKTKENFENYKIQPGAYNVLKASKDLGKVQTKLEKKRDAIQFCKEGFEYPESDEAFKRKHGGDSCGTSLDPEESHQMRFVNDIDLVERVIAYKEVVDKPSLSSGLSQEPNCSDQVKMVDQSSLVQCSKVVSEDSDVQQDIKIHALSSINDTGDFSILKDRLDERLNLLSGQTGSLPDSVQSSVSVPTVVHVARPVEVENKRKDLPIVMMEQEIMEAINYNPTVIICGETGCGKTTQVPQFLYEAGFGSNQCSMRSGIIGVTQPRRVAVLATAKRVAFELGLRLGKEVGFQVRHDKKIGDNCSIKFMTDGILLRELKYDILLRRYSVLILDEAHERSLNTDILIGMLSRIIKPRQELFEKQQKLLLSGHFIEPKDRIFPLKLILMSATMRVEDFKSGGRLFRDPPLVEVPARQFPVTIHFSKRTETVDYIGQAYKKVMSIHKKLPQGGILVFVTGQREVEYLCRKLCAASKEFRANAKKGNIDGGIAAVDVTSSVEGIKMNEINEAFDIDGNSTDPQADRFSSYNEDPFDYAEIASHDSYDSGSENEEIIIGDDEYSVDMKSSKNGDDPLGVLGENLSLTSLKDAFEGLSGKRAFISKTEGNDIQLCTLKQCTQKSIPSMEKLEGDGGPRALHVLPLYAMLPAAAQLRVFEDVKEGERLVVVATNVAETSLTIPGIKYVVDTGREKVKKYCSATGVESYEVQWISKASAAQRAGRAGRTGPGHCYRLYSSAVFSNIFPDFSCAEIRKVPVEGVILLLKSMNIDKVDNFPFPTPPEATAMVEAERCLKALEALDGNGRLTTLGRTMSHYPMSPRHSRMLLTLIQIMKNDSYSRANLVLAYAVAAAAALSLSSPFVWQFEGNNSDMEQGVETDISDDGKVMREKEKLMKKKLKESTKAARARFSNPSSDALTVVYALQCFELSGSPLLFCKENALHLKTMEEMCKLRKQLLQLVFNQSVNSSVEQDFLWTHGTVEDVESSWRIASTKNILLQNEEELLCQAICAGWVDRVAKRVRRKLGSEDRKVNAVRYQACMVKEDVFLHRRSSITDSAPEFLVYSELLHTKRPYMHGATRVKSDWLVKYGQSLCSYSRVSSECYYDSQKDQILRCVNPIFGPHGWELPMHSLQVSSDDEQCVAAFACALLEGRVLPCLKHVQRFMAAPPSTILRPEFSSQRRVWKLVNKLKMMSIVNCEMLKKVWEENSNILSQEILEWFKKDFHNNFEQLWSQMLSEVHLQPQERFLKKVNKGKGFK